MIAHRLTLRALALSCALIGCLALGVSQAPAAITHEYLSQITEVPAVGPQGESISEHGALTEVNSLTADSGDVWLAEHIGGTSSYRVDEFNASSGAFVTQLPQVSGLSQLRHGLAVDRATGDIYVVGYNGSAGVVAVFGSTGSPLGQWTGTDTPSKGFGCLICGGSWDSLVAVDNSTGLGDWAKGDVYLADPDNNVVDVFTPEAGGKEKLAAELTGASPSEPFSGLFGIAVSAFNGEVLILDNKGINIFKPAALTGQYEFVGKLSGPPPSESFGEVRNLAVDGADGDIYVAEETGVDEFAANGGYLARITGSRAPEGNFLGVNSVAVDPSTHRLFIGDNRILFPRKLTGSAVDVFGPNTVVPDVTTEAASNVKFGSATLNGTVDPDNVGEATCQFDWGTSPVLGQVASCSASVADGGSAVPVNADIVGLRPYTTYYYRLQATNTEGTNFGEASQDQAFTTTGPGTNEVWASNVASSSATLDAKINPNHAPTTYYFQYGTDSGYGSESPLPPGVAIGSGSSDVEVDQHLQGLMGATTYHYRVVAVSELAPGEFEVFDGVDETFTTQDTVGGSVLPDGRAWEMVSPPNKQGAALQAVPAEWGGLIQAAVDGSAVSYIASAPTEENPPDNPAIERVQLVSSRGSGGWATKVIATPHDAPTGVLLGDVSEYKLFSEDLSLAAVEPKGDTPLSGETSERSPYLRHDATCEANLTTCYQPLVNAVDDQSGVKFGGSPEDLLGEVRFEDATPDLSHVVLDSRVALTSAPSDKGGLYEWTAGKLEKINVPPADEEGSTEQTSFLGNPSSLEGNFRHVVSDDGSRIIWGRETSNEHRLYMRDMPKKETIRLDVPEAGAPGGAGEPVFQAASSDGARIFFTDIARLTVDSTAINGRDLYEFDVETDKLTDLTSDGNPKEQADVQGFVLGASDDGSYVYFVANGVLAPGATPGDCHEGETATKPGVVCNLYVRHDGVTTFIAALSGEDENGTFSSDLSALTARVSSNGRWLAFMSDASLTGYDNRDVTSGARDEEVFIYDANANRLRCASCNPTGARPAGVFDSGEYPGLLFDHQLVWSKRWLAAAVPGWTGTPSPLYQPRYLFDSGRLFFDSSEALVPHDTDGTWDVYEYEPEGVGDCEGGGSTFSEASSGCVGLISSGGSPEESIFADASENGDSVFFLTSSELLSSDYDHALDLYDARVCSTASPCLPTAPAVPPPCSTGDSCKPAPTLQPESFGAPSSETFSGAGNVSAPAPGSSVEAKSLTRAQPLTRAQKLAKALKLCRKKRAKRKRLTCERQARRLYAGKAAGKPAGGKSLSVRALRRRAG